MSNGGTGGRQVDSWMDGGMSKWVDGQMATRMGVRMRRLDAWLGAGFRQKC